MEHLQPAVHRTVFVVDVEGFGNQRRTNQHRLAVREGMYRAVRQAFSKAGVPWADCYQESCGDGVFVLIPAEVPKGPFVGSIPRDLAEALREHNAAHRDEERIRLRVALHAGEVYYDEHGVTAASINLAFRLLDAAPLKAALRDSPGTLAMIVSSWFFDEVVRHSPAGDAATYRPVQVAVKETSTVAWICLPDRPYPADEKQLEAVTAGLTMPVPRQLLSSPAHFVGRGDQLRRLTRLLDTATRRAEMGAIIAIDGIAGVGKTALALCWANKVAQRFPDGQLYVNLRGFDPSGAPMAPAEVVRGFLDAFGVPADRIPVDSQAQAQLYRSVLAGRRVLVMLDNARDADQVCPLLPGPGACLVLVTSRRRLADLEEAVPFTLDTLAPAEAERLFARLAPASSREPRVAAELARRCGCLPLAIQLLGARLRHHPSWSVTDLLAALEETQDDLEEIHAGNRTVAAAFELSYRDLQAGEQRGFRALGLHPGADIDARAAAALTGTDLAQARQMLDVLYDNHLIEETVRGRYEMHDLLRAYARALAAADEAADRDARTGRLLDFYLAAARAADGHLAPDAAGAASRADLPATIPRLSSRHEALAWMQAERQNLQACVEHAAATGRYNHAVGIADATRTFLYDAGYWDQARRVHEAAAAAAQVAGDRHAQAGALINLGATQRLVGDYPAAMETVKQALELSRGLGDRRGQARALIDLGAVQLSVDDYPAAIESLSEARETYRGLGDRPGQASALYRLGTVYCATFAYADASQALAEALQAFRDLGDRLGQANALCYLGGVQYDRDDYPAAAETLTQALSLFNDLGNRLGQVNTLAYLGPLWTTTGDYPAATDALKQALDLSRGLGYRLGEAHALNYLGAVHQATGDCAAATSTLRQAMDIYRSIADRQGEAGALCGLGAVQHEAGDYPAAARSLDRALDIFRDIGDPHGQARTLNYRANLLLASVGPDEALARFTAALGFSREIQSPLQEARALAGVGRCLAFREDSDAAADHLRRALAIYQQLNVPESAGVAEALASLVAPSP